MGWKGTIVKRNGSISEVPDSDCGSDEVISDSVTGVKANCSSWGARTTRRAGFGTQREVQQHSQMG